MAVGQQILTQLSEPCRQLGGLSGSPQGVGVLQGAGRRRREGKEVPLFMPS